MNSKLIIYLITALTLLTLTNAIPITIDEVKINGDTILTDRVNRLDIERGDEMLVRVRFTSNSNLSDVEVLAFISGSEVNTVKDERLTDQTAPFHAESGVSYTKNLRLTLSKDVEVDNYKLRIVIADRNGQELVQSYNLKIDTKRHDLKVEDIILSPGNQVKAGRALVAKIRVENKGQLEQRNVKVTVSLPELGASATSFINEIENQDEQEETEELLLRIPKCQRAGIYTLKVDLEFNNGRNTASETRTIEVQEDPACAQQNSGKPATVITLGSRLETIQQGGNAIFPVTIENHGSTSKSYTLNVNAPKGLQTKVSPTTTAVVEAGKTQTFFVFAQADPKITTGLQVITANVVSGSETLEQLSLTANVTPATGVTGTRILEIILIVLIVVLVVIGLIIAFTRMSEPEQSKPQSEPYYG
jgi:uncharacterized membrane protein